MKPFVYLNIASVVWALFLLNYLPESKMLETNQSNQWLFIIVSLWTIVPTLLMIYITAWISNRMNRKETVPTVKEGQE
jgi:Na+/melibiose symporter-like transporter